MDSWGHPPIAIFRSVSDDVIFFNSAITHVCCYFHPPSNIRTHAYVPVGAATLTAGRPGRPAAHQRHLAVGFIVIPLPKLAKLMDTNDFMIFMIHEPQLVPRPEEVSNRSTQPGTPVNYNFPFHRRATLRFTAYGAPAMSFSSVVLFISVFLFASSIKHL